MPSENTRMASCQPSQIKTASTSAPFTSACWGVLRLEVPELTEYNIDSIMLYELYFGRACGSGRAPPKVRGSVHTDGSTSLSGNGPIPTTGPRSGERDEQHTTADRA